MSYDFQDTSLMCDGSSTSVLADEITGLISGAAGYTVSVWVMPMATDDTPAGDMPAAGGMGRRLLSEEVKTTSKSSQKRRSARRKVRFMRNTAYSS